LFLSFFTFVLNKILGTRPQVLLHRKVRL
jgi:hypothetical protein